MAKSDIEYKYKCVHFEKVNDLDVISHVNYINSIYGVHFSMYLRKPGIRCKL